MKAVFEQESIRCVVLGGVCEEYRLLALQKQRSKYRNHICLVKFMNQISDY